MSKLDVPRKSSTASGSDVLGVQMELGMSVDSDEMRAPQTSGNMVSG
jgi:hypothetical protein